MEPFHPLFTIFIVFLMLLAIMAILFVACAVTLLVVFISRRQATRVEITDEAIRAELPIRRLRTIPWDSISRIDLVATFEGAFGDEIDVIIYWGNDRVRIPERLALDSGLLKKLSSFPGVDAVYSLALKFEPQGFEWLHGRRFTVYQRPDGVNGPVATR